LPSKAALPRHHLRSDASLIDIRGAKLFAHIETKKPGLAPGSAIVKVLIDFLRSRAFVSF
jgi:hypothetical protein